MWAYSMSGIPYIYDTETQKTICKFVLASDGGEILSVIEENARAIVEQHNKEYNHGRL